MTADQKCIACGVGRSPKLPTCLDCWLVMPVRLRVQYVRARRRARNERVAYEEILAAVLTWAADRRAATL